MTHHHAMVVLAVHLLVLVACGADVREVADGSTGGGGAGDGGGAGAPPVSICRSFTTKEACCAETCLWLNASDGFPGVCFGAEEQCIMDGCPDGQLCFERGDIYSSVGLGAQCRTEYPNDGQTFAACVDACPPQLATFEKCIAND